MKTLKKFNLLYQEICEEIQTYNDKPGFPGGNNCKHSDAGSITGNCCKEYSTDPGNIGGKTDTITGIEEDISDFKFPINQSVFVYGFTSNISNDEFTQQENVRVGIIQSRKKFNGTNFYGVQFPTLSVIFSFPEWKLGYTPKEAKLNYFQHKSLQNQIQQDACVAPAGMRNCKCYGTNTRNAFYC